MNNIIIKILGFLIGLFTTLAIINYFDIKNKKIEKFELSENLNSKVSISNIQQNINNNEDAFIPYHSYKFMCINTFFDITKIDNNTNRWYECDLLKEKYDLIFNNENHYFTFDKIINVKSNSINKNGAYGADLNSIELRGPKSFYFANDIEKNELNEFTILMSIKIKDITSNNNILFELTGNTEIINDENNKPRYSISIVNINIKLNNKKNYDFIITIGDNVYSGEINNIELANLKNNDFIILGLIYTNTDITFLLNKQIFKYTNKDSFKVKLGSTPLILNKQGTLNFHLYSFVFYKIALPSSEYLLFFKHNYYYLSGLNKLIEQNLKVQENSINQNNDLNLVNSKFQELQNQIYENKQEINKKLEEQSINKENIKYEEIKPFNITSIKNTHAESPLSFLVN